MAPVERQNRVAVGIRDEHLAKRDQLVRLPIRERPQEHAVDDREGCGGRADVRASVKTVVV
jgi:hypothetical protein